MVVVLMESTAIIMLKFSESKWLIQEDVQLSQRSRSLLNVPRRPLNLYSQAQLERGLIPDGEEEWFLRRGGIDVKCGVHAKEFNVVSLEYFSRE